MIRRNLFSLLLMLLVSGAISTECQTLSVEPWPEADSLFRKNRYWLGADCAYSRDLGKGRVLWLFGDSFIALTSAASRHQSTMVRNTVAIQKGYDPSRASVKFYWQTQRGKAAAFFRDNEKAWFWPGDAVLVRGRLLVFLMKIRAVKTGLGFEAFGWAAVAIDNPEQEPVRWHMRWIDGAANDLNVIIGSGGVLQSDDFVYAFGSREPDGKHDVYLVRWPAGEAAQGKLKDPSWWCGEKQQWVRQPLLKTKPVVVFSDAQTEFSVHWDAVAKHYLQVQTSGFGAAVVSVRTSTTLTGPWSPLQSIYRPPESDRAGLLVYAGKAHPELRGADLILTYVANNSNFGELVKDTGIYYPRFLRVKFQR